MTIHLRPHKAGAGPAALVVNFLTFEDNVSAADLVSDARPGRRVLIADPVDDMRSLPSSIEQLARAYVDALISSDETVDVVVGYCTGAPLAAAMVRCLADSGVRLLLITPTFPTQQHVLENWTNLVERLFGPEPGDVLLQLPREHDAARDHARVVLRDGIWHRMSEWGMGARESSSAVDYLHARYCGWMDFLLTSSQARTTLLDHLDTIAIHSSESEAEAMTWATQVPAFTHHIIGDFSSDPDAASVVRGAMAQLLRS